MIMGLFLVEKMSCHKWAFLLVIVAIWRQRTVKQYTMKIFLTFSLPVCLFNGISLRLHTMKVEWSFLMLQCQHKIQENHLENKQLLQWVMMNLKKDAREGLFLFFAILCSLFFFLWNFKSYPSYFFFFSLCY